MNLSQFAYKNKFLMLAIDHRKSLRKLLNSENPDQVSNQEIIQIKSQIIKSLSDQFSGVLIDSEYGIKAYENKKKPFLLCIEKMDYIEEGDGRITQLQYSAKDLKEMGAFGVKLLLYYNQDSSTANIQMETAKKVSDQCRENDLPFFLELVTYDEKGSKSEQVLNAVSMFLDQGIRADVFKLEYPGDAESCKLLTEYLGNTPWILLTLGKDFETFKKELKVAVENGAKGFLAGRSIWQEACGMRGKEREEFLKNVVTRRFEEICELVL